jgi:hypothetical protein
MNIIKESTRVYPKVSWLDDNEINNNNNNKHSLRSNKKGYGGKLTRLTHKIVIQLHLVAESCTIRSSRSRRPVRKYLDTPSYVQTKPYHHLTIRKAFIIYKQQLRVPFKHFYEYTRKVSEKEKSEPLNTWILIGSAKKTFYQFVMFSVRSDPQAIRLLPQFHDAHTHTHLICADAGFITAFPRRSSTGPKQNSLSHAHTRSRGSSVGIATGYGLDDRESGVQFRVGWKFSSSPRRSDRLWGPLSLLSNGYQGLFVGM